MLKQYELLGFPGCMGSVDVTHLHYEKCPAMDANTNAGKEGHPTRAYQVPLMWRPHGPAVPTCHVCTFQIILIKLLASKVTCDHTGRILASTRGFNFLDGVRVGVVLMKNDASESASPDAGGGHCTTRTQAALVRAHGVSHAPPETSS